MKPCTNLGGKKWLHYRFAKIQLIHQPCQLSQTTEECPGGSRFYPYRKICLRQDYDTTWMSFLGSETRRPLFAHSLTRSTARSQDMVFQQWHSITHVRVGESSSRGGKATSISCGPVMSLYLDLLQGNSIRVGTESDIFQVFGVSNQLEPGYHHPILFIVSGRSACTFVYLPAIGRNF